MEEGIVPGKSMDYTCLDVKLFAILLITENDNFL